MSFHPTVLGRMIIITDSLTKGLVVFIYVKAIEGFVAIPLILILYLQLLWKLGILESTSGPIAPVSITVLCDYVPRLIDWINVCGVPLRVV